MSYYPKDTIPTNGSTNVIESNAVFDALHGITPELSYTSGTSWCLLGSVTCPANSTTTWELSWIGSLTSFTISGLFKAGASIISYREVFISQHGGAYVSAGILNPSGLVMEVWYNRAIAGADAGYIIAGQCSTPFTFTSVITNPTGGVTQAPIVRRNGSATTFIGSDTFDKMDISDSAVTVVVDMSIQGAQILPVQTTVTSGGTTVGTFSGVHKFTGTQTHTYTMPPLTGGKSGRTLWLKNKSSGLVVVNRSGTDTLDGGTSGLALTSGMSLFFTSFGTDWTLIF